MFSVGVNQASVELDVSLVSILMVNWSFSMNRLVVHWLRRVVDNMGLVSWLVVHWLRRVMHWLVVHWLRRMMHNMCLLSWLVVHWLRRVMHNMCLVRRLVVMTHSVKFINLQIFQAIKVFVDPEK